MLASDIIMAMTKPKKEILHKHIEDNPQKFSGYLYLRLLISGYLYLRLLTLPLVELFEMR